MPYWEKIQSLFMKAKKLETKDFRVFIMKERFQDLALQKKTYDVCYFQHFSTCVGADMNLYPCCALKYSKYAVLGNLMKHSFKEIWLGEQRIKWLERKATSCPNCWFDRPNEFIEYLLLDNPPHKNFI
jgi:sulfatase maturation enzyme AslB (radical SAM superfamily)